MFLLDWWQRRRVRQSLVRRACDFAKGAVSTAYPHEVAAGLRVRAVEHHRVVIAVIIEPPYQFFGTPPYRLIAVSNDLSSWEELSQDDSLYRLRGIK